MRIKSFRNIITFGLLSCFAGFNIGKAAEIPSLRPKPIEYNIEDYVKNNDKKNFKSINYNIKDYVKNNNKKQVDLIEDPLKFILEFYKAHLLALTLHEKGHKKATENFGGEARIYHNFRFPFFEGVTYYDKGKDYGNIFNNRERAKISIDGLVANEETAKLFDEMSKKDLPKDMQQIVSLNWLVNKAVLPYYLLWDKYGSGNKSYSDIENFSRYSGVKKEDMYKLVASDIIYNVPKWWWHISNALGSVKERPENINLASYIHPSFKNLGLSYDGEKVTGNFSFEF